MMSAGDKIRAHQCNYPQCGRVFLKANNLKQHERTHTGERPYECNICGKKFKQNGSLYNHQRVHSDAPLVKCSVESCSSVFTTSRNMRRHLKDRHKDFSFPENKNNNNFENSANRHRESSSLESLSCEVGAEVMDFLDASQKSLLQSFHETSPLSQQFPIQPSLHNGQGLVLCTDWSLLFGAVQMATNPISLPEGSGICVHTQNLLFDQQSKFLYLLNAINNEPFLPLMGDEQWTKEQNKIPSSHDG